MRARAISSLLVLTLVYFGLARATPCCADVDAPAVRAVGLRDVARWAAQESPSVDAARARVTAAEARVRAARARYAPTLDATSDLDLRQQQQLYFVPDAPNQKTRSSTMRLSGGARVDWLLFDFLARPAEVLRAREERKVETQRATQVRFESVRTACERYVAVLTTQRLRDNAALSTARRSAISSAIARLIEAGLRPRVDLQRAEIEALGARAELAVLNARMAAESASLSAAMGLDPTTNLVAAELDEALLEIDLPERELSRHALRGRPELEAQRARIDGLRAARTVTRARQLPSFSLFLGASAQRDDLLRGDGIDGNASLFNGGLSLRWNLLNLPNARDVVTVKAELEAERAVLRSELLAVNTDAVVGQRQVSTAREATAQAVQLLAAARSTRDAQSRRYEVGEASLLELLDAEQTEQEARSRHILAQRELSLAQIALLDALGALEQRLVN